MKVCIRSLVAGVLMTALVLGTTSCGGQRIQVGPIRITTSLGHAWLVRDAFTDKTIPIVYREDFCDLPSESDLSDEFLDVGGFDVSALVHLTELDLVQTQLNAETGDFNFLSELTVRIIPAPIGGEQPDPVVLGTASNPNGLGSTVVLVPPTPVDLLELIRLNDQADEGECAQIEVEATPRSIPLEDVYYETLVTIDAFAEIGV